MFPFIISIGGFNLRIQACDKQEKTNILRTYGRFLTEKTDVAAVTIRIRDFVPAYIWRKRVFSGSKNWDIFKSDGKYCIELKDDDPKVPSISNRAIFDTSFLNGTIFFNRYRRPTKAASFGYPVDQLFFSYLLALNKGVLIHGCGLRYKDEGSLFIGPSGAGKSTIGNLFKKYRKATVLNDDKIIIRQENKDVFIYGTPWHGTLRSYSAQKARLKKIFFLRQAVSNRIVPLNKVNAVARLASLSFLPFYEKRFTLPTLKTLHAITQAIPNFELYFKPNKNCIDLIDDKL